MFQIEDLVKKREKNKAFAVSVIGSGGKTTLLRTLAFIAKKNGFRTVLTTTTHMLYPFSPFIRIDDDTDPEIGRSILNSALEKYGILLSADDQGQLAPNSVHPICHMKLSSPSQKNIELFLETADLVISEADGSKRLPMKALNDTEPVLLPNSDLVILVFGISAIGRPLNEVCHRYEIATALLKVSETERVTEEMAAELIRSSYLPRLKKENLVLLINQADTDELTKKAKRIADLLLFENYHILGNNPLKVNL